MSREASSLRSPCRSLTGPWPMPTAQPRSSWFPDVSLSARDGSLLATEISVIGKADGIFKTMLLRILTQELLGLRGLTLQRIGWTFVFAAGFACWSAIANTFLAIKNWQHFSEAFVAFFYV